MNILTIMNTIKVYNPNNQENLDNILFKIGNKLDNLKKFNLSFIVYSKIGKLENLHRALFYDSVELTKFKS